MKIGPKVRAVRWKISSGESFQKNSQSESGIPAGDQSVWNVSFRMCSWTFPYSWIIWVSLIFMCHTDLQRTRKSLCVNFSLCRNSTLLEFFRFYLERWEQDFHKTWWFVSVLIVNYMKGIISQWSREADVRPPAVQRCHSMRRQICFLQNKKQLKMWEGKFLFQTSWSKSTRYFTAVFFCVLDTVIQFFVRCSTDAEKLSILTLHFWGFFLTMMTFLISFLICQTLQGGWEDEWTIADRQGKMTAKCNRPEELNPQIGLGNFRHWQENQTPPPLGWQICTWKWPQQGECLELEMNSSYDEEQCHFFVVSWFVHTCADSNSFWVLHCRTTLEYLTAVHDMNLVQTASVPYSVLHSGRKLLICRISCVCIWWESLTYVREVQ